MAKPRSRNYHVGKPTPCLLAVAVLGTLSMAGCAGGPFHSRQEPAGEVTHRAQGAELLGTADSGHEVTHAGYREEMDGRQGVAPAVGYEPAGWSEGGDLQGPHRDRLPASYGRSPGAQIKKGLADALMRTGPYNFVVRDVIPKIRLSTRYGKIRGAQFHEAYRLLRPGDIVFHKDTTNLNSLIVGGTFSHAALCVSKDGRHELAEMVAHGYQEVTFFDELRAATRIAIGRCRDWSPDYTEKVIRKCRSFKGVDYDRRFELGADALYCSELIYQADFQRRLDLSLEDLLGMGQPYVSAENIWQARNLDVIWDSGAETSADP